MPDQPSTLLSLDPSQPTQLSGRSPVEIFGQSVGSFMSLVGEDPGGLNEAAQRREAQLQSDVAQDAFSDSADNNFLSELMTQQPASPPEEYEQYLPEAPEDSTVSTPSDNTKLSSDLTGFVKQYEGFSPKAFGDYKQTSIGYGTKAKAGEKSISREEAEKRLGSELAMHRKRVVNHAKKYGYDLTDNQVDALTSFDFNTGRISQLTNNGKRTKKQIADAMLRYNKAGGKTLRGLTNRRKAEQSLFLKGY